MIGKMRHKISVLDTVLGENFGFEEPTEEIAVRFTTWAKITEISRKDALREGLDQETEQYKVIIRSAIGSLVVKKDDKLEWNNERYNVRTSPKMLNLENKEFYEFVITKGK